MELTRFDVAVLVRELQVLTNAKINQIYQIAPERFILRLYRSEKYELLVSTGRVHLTKYRRKTPKQPSNLAMLLRKHLRGGRIIEISQPNFDRIMELHVQREDTKILLIELFSDGNIILLGPNRNILFPLKSSPRAKRGYKYEYPPPQPNPMDISADELREMLERSDRDLVRTLASKLAIGKLYAEEICFRLALDKNIAAKEVPDKAPLIRKELDLMFEKPKPHITNGLALPFDLSTFENQPKEYLSSFNEALDEVFIREEEIEAREHNMEKFERLESIKNQQTDMIRHFENEGNVCVAKAEAIYADYSEIHGLLRSNEPEIKVEIDNLDITLDTSLSVHENAQRYYEKAKKARKKLEGARKALRDTIERIESLREDEMRYEVSPYPTRQKKRWYDRFRWFFSSDNFLVIGGRDATSNEEIVSKYMDDEDIFFHVEGYQGPVVVIKTGGEEVPENTLEEAARFAAAYSNAWKAGLYGAECYCVKPSQVSKSPEHGEYIGKGMFVIRGKRRYFKIPLEIPIGIEIDGEAKLTCFDKRVKYYVTLIPGEKDANEIAKEISNALLRMANKAYKNIVKRIASPDEIMKLLPPGKSTLR